MSSSPVIAAGDSCVAQVPRDIESSARDKINNVERVRLIYEQIEEAKKYILAGSVLQLRLSLILLDNAVELMMYRELMYDFASDDHYRPSVLSQWFAM